MCLSARTAKFHKNKLKIMDEANRKKKEHKIKGNIRWYLFYMIRTFFYAIWNLFALNGLNKQTHTHTYNIHKIINKMNRSLRINIVADENSQR